MLITVSGKVYVLFLKATFQKLQSPQSPLKINQTIHCDNSKLSSAKDLLTYVVMP